MAAIDRREELPESDIINYESYDAFEDYHNPKLRLALYTGPKRNRMCESIRRFGVMVPVIVRESTHRGKLEVISGHNRIDICRELNKPIPYIKRELTDEEADMLCIDSNILNRQLADFKTSELAHLLKVRRDILAHQGVADLENETVTDKIQKEYELSASKIKRYIKLNSLIAAFLEMLDNNQLAFLAGYHLAFLDEEIQNTLLHYLQSKKLKCSLAHAEALHEKFGDRKNINIIDLDDIFKQKERVPKKLSISYASVKEYIPVKDWAQAENIIIEALKEYYKLQDKTKESV